MRITNLEDGATDGYFGNWSGCQPVYPKFNKLKPKKLTKKQLEQMRRNREKAFLAGIRSDFVRETRVDDGQEHARGEDQSSDVSKMSGY